MNAEELMIFFVGIVVSLFAGWGIFNLIAYLGVLLGK